MFFPQYDDDGDGTSEKMNCPRAQWASLDSAPTPTAFKLERSCGLSSPAGWLAGEWRERVTLALAPHDQDESRLPLVAPLRLGRGASPGDRPDVYRISISELPRAGHEIFRRPGDLPIAGPSVTRSQNSSRGGGWRGSPHLLDSHALPNVLLRRNVRIRHQVEPSQAYARARVPTLKLASDAPYGRSECARPAWPDCAHRR